jgi:hypothetical protein
MNALTGNARRTRFIFMPFSPRETLSIENSVSLLFSSPWGNHINGKEMSVLIFIFYPADKQKFRPDNYLCAT